MNKFQGADAIQRAEMLEDLGPDMTEVLEQLMHLEGPFKNILTYIVGGH